MTDRYRRADGALSPRAAIAAALEPHLVDLLARIDPERDGVTIRQVLIQLDHSVRWVLNAHPEIERLEVADGRAHIAYRVDSARVRNLAREADAS